MYPIFTVSIVMFALLAHSLCVYWSLNQSFSRGRKGGGGAPDSGLNALLAQYCASRCTVPELNLRLGEELGKNFLARLGVEGKSIMLCGSIAMLLGLLGTVSGMINSFEAIQLFGVGNTKSFASGISEALLTTQSGLLVGVIGVVAGQGVKRLHKKLQMRVFRYIERIEKKSDVQCGVCYVA